MAQKELNLMNRFRLVLKKEDMERIRISDTNDEEIIVDLHELGTKEAMVLVNNIINLNRDNCNIKVIHGYNHGTALKDMINSRFKNPRIVSRHGVASNLGVTVIQCRAMC
jgi:hypothetical protein